MIDSGEDNVRRENAVEVSVKITKLITDSVSVIIEWGTRQVAMGGKEAVLDKCEKLVEYSFLDKKDEDLGTYIIH